MSEHLAAIRWNRTSPGFDFDSYNRAHEVSFKEGAIVLPASSAPAYKGEPGRVDPEEAFVGALASCHMLTFLALCSKKRLVVDAYEDDAVGVLDKGPNGKLAVARVTLRPKVRFAPGTEVNAEQLAQLHHRAHEGCFIANSVTTDVSVEPRD
ncbi:OsmC family protein [Vulgatibacter incomptus]|uniref:OsmC/Ohr family protein n=1 Tax=Vulgatibacter incomptus TaxID=1391653 RepID=A0A0K1P9P2_9BACT|nr:OsmC family protein [Vulgatibacter incomptus]AKU90156.1 OsmC/Ohr family protein [Vulgatibacter incomptus]